MLGKYAPKLAKAVKVLCDGGLQWGKIRERNDEPAEHRSGNHQTQRAIYIRGASQSMDS